MVCTANDLLGWKDFPKGLRVLLLLDEDKDNTISGASEIRSKLEDMDYNVTVFYSETEALAAISNNSEGFHLAIVEVNQANTDGRFKFLESAKDLPTIMTSDVDCLSTMMKCIALGAVEFLKKPLSEDKLRNIWQHVVHKAFNAVQSERSETLKPEKESIFSILHFQMKTQESNKELRVETESGVHVQERSEEISAGSDKYPAPSTPQIKHGVRSIDDGDCQDQANDSMEKESMELDGECKSVETTCDNLVDETTVEISPSQGLENGTIKEEDELTDISKTASDVSAHPSGEDRPVDLASDGRKADEGSGLSNSRGNKSNRKKVKVDWTPELHKKFVQAVEKLGVDQAIPSRILEMMNVEGLTRHNVASHLQKYRIQRRHILPKESERRWPQPKPYPTQRNCYPQKPVMAYPTYHPPNHGQIYPAWVPRHTYPPHMWHPPYYPTWQSAESWQWNPSYQGMHADAWGCPMMPPLLGPSHLPFSQNPSQFQSSEAFHNNKTVPKYSFDEPGEEILDKVVKEAISKPWLPLPLGLKPPSTESVITELSKQGISTIPPYGSRLR